MNTTIAHRERVHLPLTPIIAVAATVLVAAAVLILINQPTFTGTKTETSAGTVTAVQPVDVPKPENPAARRQVMDQAQAEPARVSRTDWRAMHNHPEGTTLDRTIGGSFAAAPVATGVIVQTENGLSHFPGKFPGPR
jgi:hypothetical protein